MKVLATQLCMTLCNSMDYSPPGFYIHGILQARILEWIAIPGDLSQGIFRTHGLNMGLFQTQGLNTGRFLTI